MSRLVQKLSLIEHWKRKPILQGRMRPIVIQVPVVSAASHTRRRAIDGIQPNGNGRCLIQEASPNHKGRRRGTDQFSLGVLQKAKIIHIRLTQDDTGRHIPLRQGIQIGLNGSYTRCACRNGDTVPFTQMPQKQRGGILWIQFFKPQALSFSYHFTQKIAKVLSTKRNRSGDTHWNGNEKTRKGFVLRSKPTVGTLTNTDSLANGT